MFGELLLLLQSSFQFVQGSPVIPGSPQSRVQPILRRLGYVDWNDAKHHVDTHVPTYAQFIRETRTAFDQMGGTWNCTPLASSLGPVLLAPYENFFGLINATFFVVGLGLCLVLNRVRALVIPLIRDRALRSGLSPLNANKIPESLWKGAIHAILWCCTCYVVIISPRHRFFHRPCEVWSGIAWNPRLYIDPPSYDLQFIYCLQLAHYLHALHATLQLDVRRADWQASLVHHVVTISLLSLSFIRRFLPIGLLVLFMHDSSDVLLEFTKVNVYCKNRHGCHFKLNEYLSNIGFATFAINWFLFRLYWYPLKVLHACNWCIFLQFGCPDQTLYVTFNALLWALQLLHIYWFTFILLLIYRIATGKLPSVTDVRETDLESKVEPDRPLDQNGHAPCDQDVAIVSSLNHAHNGKMKTSSARTTRLKND